MAELNREAFADDHEYRRALASLAAQEREETLRLAQEAAAKAARKAEREWRKTSPTYRLVLRLRARERDKKWRRANPERQREYELKWRAKPGSREKLRAKWRKRYARQREWRLLYAAVYREAHREEHKAYGHAYYLQNRAGIRTYAAGYRALHREDAVKRTAEWRLNNPEQYAAQLARARELRQRDSDWRESRREQDAAYRMAHREIINQRQRERRNANLPHFNALRREKHKITSPQSTSKAERMALALHLEREVVALEAEGWTQKEIAELLGKSPSGVFSALKRARERAKKSQENAA